MSNYLGTSKGREGLLVVLGLQDKIPAFAAECVAAECVLGSFRRKWPSEGKSSLWKQKPILYVNYSAVSRLGFNLCSWQHIFEKKQLKKGPYLLWKLDQGNIRGFFSYFVSHALAVLEFLCCQFGLTCLNCMKRWLKSKVQRNRPRYDFFSCDFYCFSATETCSLHLASSGEAVAVSLGLWHRGGQCCSPTRWSSLLLSESEAQTITSFCHQKIPV